MDFFQRVGNFFSGKGWVSDDERRRKEQQVQAPVQPRPQPLQQVQQPNINRLNGLSGVNTPGLSGGTNIFSQAQQKVNPNPLQQANQATQQLNQNNQPKPLIPEKTVNDAPKVLTPQGQQDWVNKENKQIQIQNAINNPTQVLKPQVQQQQPKPAPVAIQQPQQQNRPQIAPSFPNPVRNPLFTQNQDSLTRALDIAKQESDKYKAEQAARNDKLDNIMRARGVSEPEIAKNRQVRIDAENRAYLSEDKARRDSNIAQMAGLATLPTRSVVSFTKGAIDGAGRTVGDSGDKLSLAVADAMYGITGDESYDKIRKYIVEQGKQRNAQYDRDLGVFKKNDTDVATAYEAGQSAQRLAQDIGTGVATGGAVPVARQFVENAADFITNANAKGKNTREMLPYAYGNAAVQAGIEKLGLDKVLSPIGKKGLTKFITGAIAEGSEEAAQQFAENAIAKHTYDPNRKYEEGVLKSGLMGAVLGGPAGMANFGAMRQTGNQPSSAMTARMNQNEATGKLEKEAIAQRQARQSSDDTSLKQAAEVNVANNQNNQLHPIQSINVNQTVENAIPDASPALKQAVTQNMSDIQHGDVNAVAARQQTTGILENYLIEQATKDVQNLASPEMKYKLNPEHEAQVRAYNEHITRLRQREEYLRGQGMSENAPAMINLRKAQEQAIYARDHIGEIDENGLKYNLSPTDNPDMRYKLDAKMQELASQNNLLARHLQLTGDENLVFNEWQNEMQKRALGYYDPKTDQINLNKLTEDTLNHELGHKLLTRVENKQDLLSAIRESYGDDYLINKYGSQYGNDLNLLAEEQLADGFSDYYKGRLNGEDKVRLGARLGIPQKVLAVYDRITEAIMGLVGKQDAIKQFYAQMETGKFRTKQQVPGGDGRVRTMSIEATRDGRNIVVINNNILEGVPSKQIVPTIRKYLNENFKGNDYPLNFGNDGTGTINRNTIRKYVDPHQTFENILIKGKMAGELPDILKVSRKYAEASDTKSHSFARDGFEYRTARIEIDGQQFDVTINVGLSSKGKLVYAFNNIKRIPANRSSRRFSSGDSSSTIANNPQDVNTDNRYQHPLQETINEMEANPKPRMTRELREAIDEFIYENIDQNLFLEHNDTNILGSHGLTWSIPRLHVDDLRHHLGKELAGDLPSNYKRRTGKRDIDTVAQEMGYDDIDAFIDEIKRVAEARRAERERKTLLAEWRRDPDVIKEAQKMIAERHAEEAKIEAEKQKKIEEAKAEEERRTEEAKAEKERIEKQQALGEILNRGLDEGPRHKIADIVHNASVATGIDEKAVAKQFAKLAEQKGYDITGERALLNTNARAGSMLDENGRLRPIDEIAPEVKEKIKLPGAEHAVPAPTTTANTATHNTRQMIYKDEKGAYHSFYEYRNIFGKWQRTGAEAPKVTSPLQKKFIDDIRSDKAVNDEAKRAFDDGLAIQYIWRENSKGVNAELVSAFDGYMQTGDKKAYRPSDKLVTFDPDKHYIESGRVVDAQTGQILGNYIEMTPDGNVTIYAGKKKMNLNMHDVDFSKIKEMRFGAGQTWTTEGIIDRITGSLRRSNSLDYFKKGGNKTKEALLNIMSETPRQANAAAVKEGNAIGEQIKDYRKNLLKQAKKHGPLKRQMLQDAVYVIEPSRPKRGEKSPSYDERLKVFEEVYGKSAAEALDQYNSFLRAVYKNLLARQNEKRVELGKDPIMERKDYITHLGEMQSGKGSIAAMYGGAKNLLSGGDVAIESRKSLPSKLAGRTGLFKPSQKFNQFAMQRVGDVKPTDPFTPLMEYSKIALHNIHMTDAITMNRSLEVAVRAASEARQEFAGKGTSGIQKLADRVDALHNSAASGNVNAEELTQVRNKLYGLERAIGRKIDGIRELNRLARKADKFGVEKLDAKDINSLKETTNNMAESLDKMLNDVNFMKLMSDSANGLTQFVGFVQEHANRLAGKTDPFQRVVNDTEPSKMRKFADATGRALMKQAALSKIVGNMNSVVAQTASLPALFSTTNPKALIQAFKLKNRKAILQKSDALALRYADDNLTDDTKFEKTMKTAGIPMEVVERGVIEYTFLAKYNQAINNGLSDADAVRYAERFINDTVTLRDQISTPRAYNRLWSASFLQFTREVTQQNRYVWNQMTNKQRVALAVNTAIAYSAIEALTGNKPGVDPLGTLIEIVGDWLSGGDDDDKDNSVQAKLERTIQKVAGQAVTAAPIATAMVNAATTKDDRKKLFGKESNLGRYDGTIPVVDLPRKLIDTKGKLDEAAKAREDGDDDKAEAKTKDAMYNILGQLPAGSQLKKTIQGIAAAHSGEVKDGKGETKVEFEKDNPFNLVQGALFGKNALIPVQVEEGKSSWVNLFKTGGLVANASNGMQINMPTNNNPQQKQATDNQIDLQGLSKKEAASIKKKLKKGDYTFQDGLLVNKNGNVEKGVYKKLAQSQGQGDEAYRNWMKAYDIDKTSTIKKEFTSFNATLNKLQNGTEKVDKAKTAVNMMTGKYKDLPDWVKERYYKESGYTRDQIEYGAMTSHNEVSLMDNYWRQKAQESSHEDLIQELANGRRKSITGQMFAKNGVINKLRAEGYITKQEARALNATQFDTDGNKITKDTSGGSGRSGSGRGRGRRGGSSSGRGSASPLSSAVTKSMGLTSSAPKANESSAKNTSINQIGQNLISKTNTQKQITNTLKKWNGASTSKNTRIRIKKA